MSITLTWDDFQPAGYQYEYSILYSSVYSSNVSSWSREEVSTTIYVVTRERLIVDILSIRHDVLNRNILLPRRKLNYRTEQGPKTHKHEAELIPRAHTSLVVLESMNMLVNDGKNEFFIIFINSGFKLLLPTINIVSYQ